MKGEFCPDFMLCGPQSKVVVEDRDCSVCDGTGIEPGRKWARCKPCGGAGKHYVCYHDMSSFAGRDYRGVTREYYCPEHGVQTEHVVGVRRCCDQRTLRVVA